MELRRIARTLLNQPNAVHELRALADEIDPPIAIRQGIAVAQYINGKRIAVKRASRKEFLWERRRPSLCCRGR